MTKQKNSGKIYCKFGGECYGKVGEKCSKCQQEIKQPKKSKK